MSCIQNCFVVYLYRMYTCYQKVGFSMLTPVLPDSPGKANILARAAQATDIRWTPVRDVPTYTKATGKTVLPAGVEVTGLPYSSTEPTDKFICENLSFETFLSAVANPDSALYTKDLNGHRNSWTYFGMVCNGVVRHALNIRRRYSTKRFLDIPGMRMIAPAGCYRPEDLQLGDVLRIRSSERSHVSMITGIFVDKTGAVKEIEISEGVRPSCTRRTYAVEAFFEKHQIKYDLLRYDFVDQVPPPEDIRFPESKSIGVDYGDCSNYLFGEEVVLSVFTEGIQQVSLFKDGEALQTLEITGKLTLQLEPGRYTATHTATGDTVSFRVIRPDIQYWVKNGILTVHAGSSDPESKVLCLDLREGPTSSPSDTAPAFESTLWRDPRCGAMAKIEELTEEERNSGIFTRPIHHDARNFKVVYENPYGIWTHTMLPLFQKVERD